MPALVPRTYGQVSIGSAPSNKGMLATLTLLAAFTSNPTLQTHDCVQGKAKVPATCGSLRVFENRTAQSGRTIDVHFILLKAVHPVGKVIYVNLGGPGSELGAVPAIADDQFLHELKGLRTQYDILFVDERGFGLSHSINCDLAPFDRPDLYFAQLWPTQLLSACRAKVAQTSDLTQYNTPNAVDDLNDLRAALGYAKLNFDVFSYGTFTALVYMRQHPDSVGAVALSGVAPPGIMNQVREFAIGSQSGFANLTTQCEHDTACHQAFPHFREHFLAFVRRFDSGAVKVQVKNDKTKRVQTVALSREVFSDAIRHALYDGQGQSLVPVVIERAYAGDTKPLATMIDLITHGFASGIDEGAFLSYTCSELMPFTDSDDDKAFARAHSWYGDYRDRAQQAACKIWNVPAQPVSFDKPVQSNAAVLMVSGTADPATPSFEGTEQLKSLPNGVQMLVRNAPHDAESPCVDSTITAFIQRGTATGLKLNACSASFPRIKFATKVPAMLNP